LPVPLPLRASSRNGVRRVAVSALRHVAAAIDTVPRASPNCSSIAQWLEGIIPYCQVVAVRGAISTSAVPGADPNSGTRLAAWKAPQMYRQSPRSTPAATRWARIRVHM
jgi:hypothetical protein